MQPAAFKRPRGRPRKDAAPPDSADKSLARDRPVDAAADEMAKKRLLPRPPGKKLVWDEMQEYFKLLTPDMWNHVALYIYRTHPRIIRQLKDPDAKNYIDVVSQPLDMEYMIEHHGGGKYHVMACDPEATTKTENKVFECDFEINSSQHPPKLNYEELDVNHKANMAYVQLLQYRGILDSKGHPMTAQPPAAAGANPDVIKQVLDFVKTMSVEQQEAVKTRIASSSEQSLSKSVGEILLEKMKQDDPNKQLLGLLGIIKEVLASNKPATDGVSWKDVITMQNEHNRTVLGMFERLSEAANHKEPAPNPQLEQFEQLLALAERLSGFRGAGGARNGWDIGLDYVRELATPLIQTIGNFMSLRMNGRPMPPVSGAGATAGAAPPSPTAFDPYANPAAMRALAHSMGSQPAPAAAPNPAGPAGGPAPNELASLIQAYGGLIIQNLNNGTPGHHFADSVVGLLGLGTHAQIVAQGEPALVQVLLATPETAIFGEPRLRKFVHEFVHFQELLDQEDSQEDSETEDVPAAVVEAAAGERRTSRANRAAR